MPPDIQSPALILAVAGTGAMGRGIAQVAAQAGISVLLYDAQPGAASNARDGIVATLGRLADKGKITRQELDAASSRLTLTLRLEQLAPAQIVIEAIVENLEIKQQLFKQLEEIVAPTCILASNTSSLSITAIASACKHPERVGGFHCFNPVALMKIVEVIDGLLTAPWVGAALMALGQRVGHTAVRAQDTPGFIVNHAGRGLVTEALRCLGEGIAEFHEIDCIMRDAAGFRMGPFELLDLIGLDVSQPVMESIYRQYYEEPRYRPSPLAAQRLVGGILGRKSGRGFYNYSGQQAQPIAAPPAPTARPRQVWVSQAQPAWGKNVRELVQRLGGTIDAGQRPAADALCVVTPLGSDATTLCLSQGLEATRTVAIDCLFGVDMDRCGRRTLMTTPLTSPEMRAAAHGLFAADGVPVSVIRDSAGLIAQRIVAMIVNIGCDIAQQRIASPRDIDRAVSLGLGYPQGPLALGDAIGASNILAILEAMQGFYGDPRYRPSPWLKRRALLEVSLLTEEQEECVR